MTQPPEITVRRARVSDAERVAAFVNRARRGQAEIDRLAVIARLGNVGFLLAERAGSLIGMLGWQAENLVVKVTDFLIQPAHERKAVSRALLAEMEHAAIELQCEASLLLLPRTSPPEWANFYELFGYEPRAVVSLPKTWRAAAHEARLRDTEAVLVKQLRSSRVGRPL